MKKRIISMITVSILAFAAVALSACNGTTDPADTTNTRSIGGVATAYAMVHGSYAGEATVTVDKDGEVMWIDFAEWLLPDTFFGTDPTSSSNRFKASYESTTAGELDATAKEAFITEAEEKLNIPANYVITATTFTNGKAADNSVTPALPATTATIAYAFGPSAFRIGRDVYEFRAEEKTGTTVTVAAGYYLITGVAGSQEAPVTEYAEKDLITSIKGVAPTTGAPKVYPAGAHAFAEKYVKAAKAGDIAVVVDPTIAGYGELLEEIYGEDMAIIVANTTVAPNLTGYINIPNEATLPTLNFAKTGTTEPFIAGMFNVNVTFNKMDKANLYWNTGNNVMAYKNNINAMREFFIENGFDFVASDFEQVTKDDSGANLPNRSAEKAWTLKTDENVKIGLNDGSSYATLSDFHEYFNVMKAAFTAAKASI